jgi:hypothetical protein
MPLLLTPLARSVSGASCSYQMPFSVPSIAKNAEYRHEHIEQIEVDLHCGAHVLIGPVEVP